MKDTIINHTEWKFSFRERLRILFGRPLRTSIQIDVSETVEILETRASRNVAIMFPKKSRGGSEMIMKEDKP